MQNDESQNEEDKYLGDLRSLWQESTTKESINIKEQAMMSRIRVEMNYFNSFFATGHWGQIIFNCILFSNAAFNIADGIRHNDIYKIAFHLAIALAMLCFIIFHGKVKFKMRSFNQSNNREYTLLQIMRVEQEIKFREKTAPLLSPVIFGLLILGLWNDLPLWSIILLVVLFITLQIANFSKKLISKELYPLRDKLQSALQQLNEH